MTTFRSKLGHLATAGGMIAVATLLVGVWSSSALAQSREPTSTSPPAAEPAGKPPAELSREAWHTAMERIPLPNRACFKASYPTLAWQEVPCTARRKRPFSPRPHTVGASGGDFQAQVTGRISSAVGSFDTVPRSNRRTALTPRIV